MDKRISSELKELFKMPNVVSIQEVEKIAFDVNDNKFLEFVIQSILDKRAKENDNKLTVVCKQEDKNGTQKNVTYIFIISNYPFSPPIIKTNRISGMYNGYGLPQVNISNESEIDSLFDNNIFNVAGIKRWGPNLKLLDIINDAQSRELDPSIDIVVNSNSKFQIEKPKGGKRKTKKRKNKRSKKSRRF